MVWDLPPLTALPAFEAAGRLLSFTRAAKSLGMTQAAISFQIRNLERSLGTQLFDRQHRSLALTQDGEVLLRAVQSGLQMIALGKREIVRADDANVVKIGASVSFCSKWLVRRIAKLQERHPHIRVQIEADDRIRDLARDGLDIVVRYLPIRDADHSLEMLIEDTVIPVCNPILIAPQNKDSTTDIFKSLSLLSDLMTDVNWRRCLDELGLWDVPTANEIRFSHSVHAIDAAISGAGMALGRLPLIADDLNSGHLINPMSARFPSDFGYFMEMSDASNGRAPVAQVARWLRDQAETTVLKLSNAHPSAADRCGEA